MTTVVIAQGTLKGGEVTTDSGYKYYEFLNIPYAQPPLGDLRFKSPQPPESWEGERDAIKSSHQNISCQYSQVTQAVMGSEDCLYLNVFTPSLPSTGSKLLPVMFYIHGGGFVYGNGIIKDEVNPELLVEKDVVIVTINYRLGVFGFINLDIPEAAGNMGLKDQVKALKWVQKNIDKFGGNKNNVTIFGISAGSASVEYLMLSPLSNGLFHKAILQSGSTLNTWAINFQYKRLTVELGKLVGFSGDLDDRRELYEYLMKVPTVELATAASKAIEQLADTALFGFVPTVENDYVGAFLTTHPYKLLKDGKFNNVPVIRGFCVKEGSIMQMLKPKYLHDLKENKNFSKYITFKLKGDDDLKYNSEFEKAYMDSAEINEDDSVVDFFGDLYFSAGVWLASKLFDKKGLTEYVYKFTYDGTMNVVKSMFNITTKGACHGDDMGYIFKMLTPNIPSDSDVSVRKNIIKMWTNFAKDGTPNIKDDPDVAVEWPEFKESSQAYLNIDTKLTIETNYEPGKMVIFEKIYEKYEK